MSLDAIANQLEKLSALQYFVEASAVGFSAVSGMMAAEKRRMDLVGTYAVALISAFGGGTLRDVLLDRRPMFWVSHEEFSIAILGLSIVFHYAAHLRRSLTPLQARVYRLYDVVDTLGLALFSISGTTFALAYRVPLFSATLFGIMTGVFGGVLRDIVLLQLPTVFVQSTLYVTCSFFGCWVYIAGLSLRWDEAIAGSLGFSTIVVLRMLAIRYNLTLPAPAHFKQRP